MVENEISDKIIGAAIEVHKSLGPGLLESAYHTCLQYELEMAGLYFQCEVPLVVNYKGNIIENAYRIDLLVEDKVVVELKSVDVLMNKHKAQVLTYLRLMKRKLGLLINFNESMLKTGLRRVVNDL